MLLRKVPMFEIRYVGTYCTKVPETPIRLSDVGNIPV